MTARPTEYGTLRPRRIVLLALCAMLFACGQIGPLYLPGEQPPASQTDGADAPVSTPSEESDRNEESQDPS